MNNIPPQAKILAVLRKRKGSRWVYLAAFDDGTERVIRTAYAVYNSVAQLRPLYHGSCDFRFSRQHGGVVLRRFDLKRYIGWAPVREEV